MKPPNRKYNLRFVFLVCCLVGIWLPPALFGLESMTADFSAAPVSGQAPLTVQFSDRSTGAVDERLWDFDFDGQPDSSQMNPIFTYEDPGVYTVNLIVIGFDGAVTETKIDFIVVEGDSETLAGESYQFNGSLVQYDREVPDENRAVSGSQEIDGPTDKADAAVFAEATAGIAGVDTRAAAAENQKDNKKKDKKDKTRKVKLRWDPNLEPSVAGYMVFYNADYSGPPYNGTGADQGDSPITVYREELNNENNPKFEISGLDDDREYFFALKAFDDEIPPNESGFSNEASTLDADLVEGSSQGGGGGGGCFIDTSRK